MSRVRWCAEMSDPLRPESQRARGTSGGGLTDEQYERLWVALCGEAEDAAPPLTSLDDPAFPEMLREDEDRADPRDVEWLTANCGGAPCGAI